MKLPYLFLFLIFATQLMAQPIKVKEQNSDFSAAQNVNSLVVELPYVSQDFIEGKIKKLFKNLGKHKESKKEHAALMVELKDMGEMPFNAYAVSEASGDDAVEVRFGFDLGGAYLNSKEHPEQFKVIEEIIEEFASSAVITWIEQIVRNEQQRLNDLEKEQKDFVKRKDHMEKEIEDFEKKIAKNKEEIKENLESQSAKKSEIDTQKKRVESVEKKLKELR